MLWRAGSTPVMKEDQATGDIDGKVVSSRAKLPESARAFRKARSIFEGEDWSPEVQELARDVDALPPHHGTHCAGPVDGTRAQRVDQDSLVQHRVQRNGKYHFFPPKSLSPHP